MRILVTGGAGFIGSNLVRQLLELGLDVTVFDNLATGARSNVEDLPISFVVGDIRDKECLASAAPDADVIVHLAALGSVPRSMKDPATTHEVNATGTLNVLEVARQQGAYVIYSSSSSVYGANPLLPKVERTWTQPISPYGASKLAAESYVLAYQASMHVPALVLRFFNVFGPWQQPDHDYAAVIPKWLWKTLRGEVIEVHGDGHQTRDFTYVETVVDVLVSAVQGRLSPSTPINLALGSRMSLLELIDQIGAATGLTPRIEHVNARPGDVRDSQNDPAELFTFFPDLGSTPLSDSLEKTANWLRDQYLIP